MSATHEALVDDLEALLVALPPEIVERLLALPADHELIEVVLDIGRRPEARFGDGGELELLEREVGQEDLQYVIDHVGSFGDDNRAGIERTLHRISAIRNRGGKIVGLTCRVGRAVFGTIEIVKDLVESGRSILIMGRPGIGKTTMLREAARVLADEMHKRVVVVDTSNEIAGDGDIPHPGIGRARRMQVPTPALQHAVMIEAVENHMPEVIVIDEIGTELEAHAARTIAERGVQLIGTAHGNTLDNLMLNPTLSDLIGGIQSVTLGDEEARRRRTQKSVLERKAPPTFDVVVEIQDRDRVVVHADVGETVDALLRGDPLAPELRWRDEAGVHRSQARPRPSARPGSVADRFAGLVGNGVGWRMEPGWRGEPGVRGEPGWRTEPGWRPDAARLEPGYREGERSPRQEPRAGSSGGWRAPRGAHRPVATTGRETGADLEAATTAVEAVVPFRAGGLADRGPVERGSLSSADQRARDAREVGRQREWRASAAQALGAWRAEEGTGPMPAPAGEAAAEIAPAGGLPAAARSAVATDLEADGWGQAPEAAEDEDRYDRLGPVAPDGYATSLPTIHALGFGISRKHLEQAIRELQLPVVVVRDVDEADVVITLKNYYRQKLPTLREAEERAIPTYVLKANTIVQMEACLTSLYALEVDPREAALRETEEAIGLVRRDARAVELSPQNAYVRRLQHQMAERANLVSRSRGREPFRRVRLYPDKARAWR